ncbi:MAG: hypothetical protein ACF8R7_03740 [Phycisphaerales bacterium JB039]
MQLVGLEAFGWIWITLGMAAGVALSPAVIREDFLGGYASRPRRLLRLGHIAMVALGVLCVLWTHSAGRLALAEPWPVVAGAALLIGAVAMPLTCALAAARKRATALFAVPVTSLIGAGALTALGLAMGGLS